MVHFTLLHFEVHVVCMAFWSLIWSPQLPNERYSYTSPLDTGRSLMVAWYAFRYAGGSSVIVYQKRFFLEYKFSYIIKIDHLSCKIANKFLCFVLTDPRTKLRYSNATRQIKTGIQIRIAKWIQIWIKTECKYQYKRKCNLTKYKHVI